MIVAPRLKFLDSAAPLGSLKKALSSPGLLPPSTLSATCAAMPSNNKIDQTPIQDPDSVRPPYAVPCKNPIQYPVGS
jgi:hypothetical protein